MLDHHTRAAKMMDRRSAPLTSTLLAKRLDVGRLGLCTWLLINGDMNMCVLVHSALSYILIRHRQLKNSLSRG